MAMGKISILVVGEPFAWELFVMEPSPGV